MRIISSWDDGCKEDLRLAELLLRYGIQATFYIPSEWQTYNLREGREPLSHHDLFYLAEHFEIGSHGVNHKLLTRIPIEEARQEIIESKHILERILDMEIDKFCYPRGYADDVLRDTVRKHYSYARNTLVGEIQESEDPVWQSTSVHVGGKRRKEYEGTNWLDEARKHFKLAQVTPGSVYHIWGHSWELTKQDAWNDLEELMKEIAV